jgi:hypothetical protein
LYNLALIACLIAKQLDFIIDLTLASTSTVLHRTIEVLNNGNSPFVPLIHSATVYDLLGATATRENLGAAESREWRGDPV